MNAVQLVHCDCEYCSASFKPIMLAVIKRDTPPAERTPHYGWAIPNRLYGAEINHEGDAV